MVLALVLDVRELDDSEGRIVDAKEEDEVIGEGSRAMVAGMVAVAVAVAVEYSVAVSVETTSAV